MTHQCKIIPFKKKNTVMDIINRILSVSCITLSCACIALNAFVICFVLLIGG